MAESLWLDLMQSSQCGILRPVVLSTSFKKMLLPFASAGHRQLCSFILIHLFWSMLFISQRNNRNQMYSLLCFVYCYVKPHREI
ncbi:hypothetical protein GQ55_9G194700 [Panicum hallii var. hallii]|uniref:Uncharacterized protein n=1 Tax=Panicum hallii var. hallii TaxID=1504633 RepID=A0A2T7C508_9POAL|nr:hypothetical protein GQ55_9G194700 [Panicum hallii var. hallii]